MGKHNDKAFQDALRYTFGSGLERQHRNGLAQGTYAACKVVYDKAVDESKTYEERINSIKKFCETFLNNKIGKAVENQEEPSTAMDSAD